LKFQVGLSNVLFEHLNDVFVTLAPFGIPLWYCAFFIPKSFTTNHS